MKPVDRAIRFALEFEQMAVDADRAFHNGNVLWQKDAMRRFTAARAAFHSLPADDRARGHAYILSRKRLPPTAWQRLESAFIDPVPAASLDNEVEP